MAIVYIPFAPKYADYIEVQLENIAWQIYCRWNFIDNAWYMDLSSVQTGTTLKGLKLVSGKNVLRPHAVSELGQMWVVDTEGKFEDPNFDDWGDRFKLLYIPLGESAL
jgi:hypothetical protein